MSSRRSMGARSEGGRNFPRLACTVAQGNFDALAAAAAESDRTVSAVVDEALTQYFARAKKGAKR